MKVFLSILLAVVLSAVLFCLAVAITSVVNNVTFADTLKGWFDTIHGFFSQAQITE